VVHTVEYSVHGALLGLDIELPATYQGLHPNALVEALRRILR
jgi:hypothetical protein